MIFLDEADRPDEVLLLLLDGITPGVITEVATPVVMDATDVTADAIVVCWPLVSVKVMMEV